MNLFYLVCGFGIGVASTVVVIALYGHYLNEKEIKKDF